MSTDGQCLFSWGSEVCSTAYLHIIIHPLVIVHHVVYYVQEEYVTTNYLGYLQGELHSFCTYQTACYAHFSICPASQLSCAGAGCAAACVRAASARRALPFNGLCVQPCSRWDMIIDICTLQAMKSNIFEYACMYLQYISLCKKAGKAYCENEKWHAI